MKSILAESPDTDNGRSKRLSKEVIDFFHEHSDLLKSNNFDAIYNICKGLRAKGNEELSSDIYSAILKMASADFILEHSSFIPGLLFFQYPEQEDIIIPSNIKDIDPGAFMLSSITSIDLSKTSLPKISAVSFMLCPNLTVAKLPKTITSIEVGAFQGSVLSSIKLPHGLQIIGKSAFQDTNLKEIVIPESVQVIDVYAFIGTPLKDVYLYGPMYKYFLEMEDYDLRKFFPEGVNIKGY